MCNRIVAIIGPGSNDCIIKDIILSSEVEIIVVTEEQMQSIELTSGNRYDEMLKALEKIHFTPFLDNPPNVRSPQGFPTDKKLQHRQSRLKTPLPVHIKKTNPRHRMRTRP